MNLSGFPNRNIIDKFYTNPEVVKKYITVFKPI